LSELKKVAAYLLILLPVQHLGQGGDVLKQLASGQHAFSKKLAAAKKPMVIVGSAQFSREDGSAIQALVQQIAAAAQLGVSIYGKTSLLRTHKGPKN
jgi:hypothetical protein